MKTHSTLRALTGALILALGSHIGLRAQDRMPPIPAEKMTDAQRTAAAEFRAARNADPNGEADVSLGNDVNGDAVDLGGNDRAS